MVVPRRASRARRALSLCVLSFLFPFAVAGTVPSVEAYCFGAADVDHEGVDPVEAGTFAGARFSLDGAKGDALKGSARVSVDSATGFSLDRAYLKARFPYESGSGAFRLTLGKAPLSWGRGFVFNAGDPVFGAVPRVTSLSDGEYRTASAWMGVAYLPFGAFSFAEAALLPRVKAAELATEVDTSGSPGISRGVAGEENERNRAGIRVVASPRWKNLQSVETGFLATDGGERICCLSIDGSLWVDWYGAVSARWGAFDASSAGPEVVLSAGIFRILDVIAGHALAFRLETLVYPDERRALFYPSLEAEIADGISLLAQGVLASGDAIADIAESGGDSARSALPWIDSGEALLSLGVSWNLLNDVALSGTAWWLVEKGDSLPGLGAQVGFRFFF